jgi:hypothetical protein
MVIGLLIAILFPLMGAPANVIKADVIVPLPSLPALPVPSIITVPSQIVVPVPSVVPSVIPRPSTRPPVPHLSPTPPVIVPGPVQTTIINRPDGTKTIVITRTVPGPVRTVVQTTPTPVPGPTKTVYTEKFSPGQTKIIKEKIKDAQRKFGLLGIIAGMLLAFVAVALVYYRGFRKGEIHDAKMIRDTI